MLHPFFYLSVVLGVFLAPGVALSGDFPVPAGIVVFIADDQGEHDAGCYGHPSIQTPNIDQLAREGLRYTNALLTTSSCSPSRSSILTGRYPHCTSAEDLHTTLPATQWTIARYLQQSGFFCAAIGKWHLGKPEKNNWDRVLSSGPGELGSKTVEVLAARPKDKPFFLWVASIDPHRPYQQGTIPDPHAADDVRVPPYLPDDPRIREDLALYYDEITRFDSQIGEVMNALKEEGIADDTLVFYLSDNGSPFPRAKTTLFDSGTRTPFLVRWPAFLEQEEIREELISTIDITPTLLEIAGVEQTTTQGVSLLPTWIDGDAPHREEVFSEANWHDYEHFSRAIRTPRFKLIRHYYHDTPLWAPADAVRSQSFRALREIHEQGNLTESQAFLFQPERSFEELYDLQEDPYELKNLIDNEAYANTLKDLQGRLDRWREETNDTIPETRRSDGFHRNGTRR